MWPRSQGTHETFRCPCLPQHPRSMLPELVIFQSSAWTAVQGQRGDGVMARVSGFHSIPSPFPTLLSAHAQNHAARSSSRSQMSRGSWPNTSPYFSWSPRPLDPSRQSHRVLGIHFHPIHLDKHTCVPARMSESSHASMSRHHWGLTGQMNTLLTPNPGCDGGHISLRLELR